MSSAIVLESAIVHVYAINQDGLCEWEQIPRLLEAVSIRSAAQLYRPFKVNKAQHLSLSSPLRMTSFCHDAASRFIYIISRGNKSRSWMLPEDLAPLIQDVVDSHPGLAFLKEAAEFHSRYVHTVIARIFYSVNRSWSGRITIGELRKSNLMEVIQLLEEEEDINQIMAYFSYEHFYVIYCKFWELDRDHDLYIDQQDLARHNDHGE
jgi:EF-hand domain/EF-hand domain pair